MQCVECVGILVCIIGVMVDLEPAVRDPSSGHGHERFSLPWDLSCVVCCFKEQPHGISDSDLLFMFVLEMVWSHQGSDNPP